MAVKGVIINPVLGAVVLSKGIVGFAGVNLLGRENANSNWKRKKEKVKEKEMRKKEKDTGQENHDAAATPEKSTSPMQMAMT